MRRFENVLGFVFALGSVLLAFLAAFVIGNLVYSGPIQLHAPADTAAADAAPTALSATKAPAVEPVVAEKQAVAPEFAAGGIDLRAGEAAFKACKACHKAEKGAAHSTGPALWGIFNRHIGSVDGFKYSADMAALSDHVWDEAALDRFLAKPKGMVKGTKMSFAGVKDPGMRANLIAWLATRSDSPAVTAKTVRLSNEAVAEAAGSAVAEDTAAANGPYADLVDNATVEIEPVPYPDDVVYQNPPTLTRDELAAIGKRVAALQAEIPTLDYQRARYHPIHFSPRIDTAANAECVVCHQEILANPVRERSPAGVEAESSLAWYQTLDTYAQAQSDFHWRHLESDFSKKVMNLQCNFCHKGNDPREESPEMLPTRPAFTAPTTPEFTMRKMVNPSETCLFCHGAMPDPANIMGLGGKWHEVRGDIEAPEAPNGCLSCHAETFRTNRHQVTYLKAADIEELARAGTSDTCFGCHGGRAWYRISYPYPRHPWPGMDMETVPDWAANRPTASKPEYQLSPRDN